LFLEATSPAALQRLQVSSCLEFRADRTHSVAAIHKGDAQHKAKCHNLANQTGGRFSSIEEIEGKAMFSFIRKLESARSNSEYLMHAIAFAAECMTAVRANLSAATQRGELVRIRPGTRNPLVGEAANQVLAAPTAVRLLDFLNAIKHCEGVHCGRADLFYRLVAVLRKQVLNPGLSLGEAAEEFQAEFRHRGRPIGKRLIGTTLLLKGLEFDHGIVLDAASLTAKELYVALTRGSRSVTILTTSATLQPAH
jgi:DNA helicase-2/ATP-dependent DNA helicase PcrA